MKTVQLKNGQTLKIRKAVESDAGMLVDMFNRLGGESDNLTYGQDEYYLNETQERLFIRAMKERSNSIFLVAFIEDKLVAYLSLATIQRGRLAHRGELGVAVLKDYWGIGIGSKLMEHLFHWVNVASTVTKIELQVRTDNDMAIELYKKWGFVIEGKIAMGMKKDDGYFDLYCMGKSFPERVDKISNNEE